MTSISVEFQQLQIHLTSALFPETHLAAKARASGIAVSVSVAMDRTGTGSMFRKSQAHVAMDDLELSLDKSTCPRLINFMADYMTSRLKRYICRYLEDRLSDTLDKLCTAAGDFLDVAGQLLLATHQTLGGALWQLSMNNNGDTNEC